MIGLVRLTCRVFGSGFALCGFSVSSVTGQGLLIPRVSPACAVGDVFTLVSKRVLKLAVGSPLEVRHIGRLCTEISNEEAGSTWTGLFTLLRGTADIRSVRRLAHRPKKTIARNRAFIVANRAGTERQR